MSINTTSWIHDNHDAWTSCLNISLVERLLLKSTLTIAQNIQPPLHLSQWYIETNPWIIKFNKNLYSIIFQGFLLMLIKVLCERLSKCDKWSSTWNPTLENLPSEPIFNWDACNYHKSSPSLYLAECPDADSKLPF